MIDPSVSRTFLAETEEDEFRAGSISNMTGVNCMMSYTKEALRAEGPSGNLLRPKMYSCSAFAWDVEFTAV